MGARLSAARLPASSPFHRMPMSRRRAHVLRRRARQRRSTARQRVVPDDLSLLGRITAIAAAGGTIGTAVLWAARAIRRALGHGGHGRPRDHRVVMRWPRCSRPGSRLSDRGPAVPDPRDHRADRARAAVNRGGNEGFVSRSSITYAAMMGGYFCTRRQTLFACASVHRGGRPADLLPTTTTTAHLVAVRVGPRVHDGHGAGPRLQHQRERGRRARSPPRRSRARTR